MHIDKKLVHRIIMITVILVPIIAVFYVMIAGVVLQWPVVSIPAIAMFFLFYWMSLHGVEGGFHRIATHNAAQTKPWVKVVYWVMGTLAWESGVIEWVAIHRKHHKFSDKDGDPHSPLEGFLHAHMGWLIDKTDADPTIYAPDLLRDKSAVIITRLFLPIAISSLVIPALIAGLIGLLYGGFNGFLMEMWLGFLWGSIIRIGFVHHVTWGVNSYSHMFGTREFDTDDQSHNSLLIGFLSGDWHNNHHGLPTTINHGIYWWQLDFVAYGFYGLEKLKLVWDLKRFTPEMAEKRKEFWQQKKAKKNDVVDVPV